MKRLYLSDSSCKNGQMYDKNMDGRSISMGTV